MRWWNEIKQQLEPGSVLELVVDRKIAPGFLLFKVTEKAQGSLHVSELNWNFGLSQSDFRAIQAGTTLRVYVIGFDEDYRKIILGRKLLPEIERPAHSRIWKDLELRKVYDGIVFEALRNKVVVQLANGLYGTFPLLEGKKYRHGDSIKVVPLAKNNDQNLIECAPPQVLETVDEEQVESVKEIVSTGPANEFESADGYLTSLEKLTQSIYWGYFTEQEQHEIGKLFEQTPNLFSKVEKGEGVIYIEFDFYSDVYADFLKNVAPSIFNSEVLKPGVTDKDLLLELSKFNFWYTQFYFQRKIEGTDQTLVERTFSLFNETVSIRGGISDDGALKIRHIKSKLKNDLLKEKTSSIRFNDVLFIRRPIIFTQYAPTTKHNAQFIEIVENKLTAFRLFESAKKKSLDLLEKQGKDFRIFNKYLESQIDFETKSANATELKMNDCVLSTGVQVDGITFTGTSSEKDKIQIDDRVSISVRTDEGRPFSIGSGSIVGINGNAIKVKSNIESFDLIKSGCFIKKISSIKQHVVQLEVLGKFFANKLPLDTFYKVFHDQDGIEPPENVDVRFEDPVFVGKQNPQAKAVEMAVGNKNILLIQGPPGTGKTTVITEIVKQLVNRGHKLLVTSQTHVAVDNVLERIKDTPSILAARIGNVETASDVAAPFLLDEARRKFTDNAQRFIDIKVDLLRHLQQGVSISEYSSESIEGAEPSDALAIQNFVEFISAYGEERALLLIELLEKWRTVIAKTPKLLTSIFLQELDVVFGTCIGIATNKELSESETMFDTVILDEAGKANISETLTAISKSKRIILVGDHKQLPPYLDKERVDYFKKYSKDLLGYVNDDDELKRALGSSFFEYLQRDGVLRAENKIMLSEQHRMHPDIGNFVSQSFYGSELKNGEHTIQNVVSLPEPFNKQIIFIDTSSDKRSIESFDGASYFNEIEAELIVKKIIPVLIENSVSIKSFAIVSPYSGQCNKIRELLANSKLVDATKAEVATLDSFQGREHDIIIFSFTRCGINKKVGFLDDARRLNVAFSRAKKKLILVGNVETLTNPKSHFDQYYTNLFKRLRYHAATYGHVYKVNELDSRKTQAPPKEGEVVTGKVILIRDFGVIVNMGSKDGLIPRSFFMTHPKNVLEVGQEIDVLVIKIDNEGKILLQYGERNAQVTTTQRVNSKDDFKRFVNEHRTNMPIEGVVQKISEFDPTTFKVQVLLKYGVRGSILVSKKITLQSGKPVKLTIQSFDFERQFVKCKLRS